MRRVFFAIILIAAVAGISVAQQTKTDTSSNASAKKQGRQIDLQSDTQLTAQLQSALDTRYAKVGDRVILKTAEAVKQDGKVIIAKGAQLLGRVTDIQKQTESTGQSHITLLFDRLRSGSTETPITASILSVTQAHSNTQVNSQSIDSDLMNQSSSSTRSTSSSRNGGGGLLGGVGNTVGGAVNTTTSTVGNVAGTTTNAVGSTVGATTNTAGGAISSLRGLQINHSGDASASGGSTLSITGGNLRFESGATFTLSVSGSAGAGNP